MTFFLTVVVLFKLFIIRGVHQATQSSLFTSVYALISIGSVAIGMYMMFRNYSDGIVNMHLVPNFLIAFMIALFLCEVMYLPFVLLDDAVGITKWIVAKFGGAAKPEVQEGRRHLIKTLGLAAMSVPFASFIYGISKGKYDFRVIKQSIAFKDLPDAFDGFTIAQFSDLHSGGFDTPSAVKKGFDMLQQVGADLIVFTGDLVNDLAEEVLPYKEYMTQLSAPYGKYSILGNHDYGHRRSLFATQEAAEKNHRDLIQHHADMNFNLLMNENEKIEKDGAFIRLIGVENWGRSFNKHGDIDLACAGCAEDEFSVLLSHDPTHWEDVILKHPKHINLTLSGHTHGAQMGLELKHFKWSPVKYFYTYWAGLYEEMQQYLYVNRGFGFLAFAGRVGVPPEITLIELRKA